MESSVREYLLVRELPMSEAQFYALSAAVFRMRTDTQRDTMSLPEMYKLLTGQTMNILDHAQQKLVHDYCREVGRIAHRNGLSTTQDLAEFFEEQLDNLI